MLSAAKHLCQYDPGPFGHNNPSLRATCSTMIKNRSIFIGAIYVSLKISQRQPQAFFHVIGRVLGDGLDGGLRLDHRIA